MLELLVKYAADHGLESEPGFKPKDVRWAIVFDGNGQFLDVIELGDVGNRKNPGQTFPKCPDLTQGQMISGGIRRSHFLVDTTSVVALYDLKAKAISDGTEDQKTIEKHQYFIQLLRDAGRAIPELILLADSLSNDSTLEQVRGRFNDHKAKPTDKVTFRIEDSFPIEFDKWHDWWRVFRGNLIPEESENFMRCLGTGELTQPVSTHPKIEKLSDVGGLASGDVLIGFDKDAFCSYGLRQSSNAAVSNEAAARYRAAFNDLIRNHSRRLAKAKVIHWFKEKVLPGDDPLAWLMEGSEQKELDAQERARKLLESIRTGELPDLVGNHYYALTLSGASGRIMVRDWMEGQFEDLVGNVFQWFQDLSIVHRDGTRIARSPKFLAVAGCTVRDLDNLAAPFVAKLWSIAVRGQPLPQSALAQALIRTKVGIIEDEPFNHARMGLMKAYHIRKNLQTRGDRMTDYVRPFLNEDHPNPAYQCGRLMAVLAALQRSALGDVGAGVVQRYYAAASTTPALVLGRVTRLSQFHLSKLDGGLARWYENKIANIWGRIKDGLPRTIDLEEQSLFALGYYQQLADMRAKKSENSHDREGEKNE